MAFNANPWSPEEIEVLRSLADSSPEDLEAALPGRSWNAIRFKRSSLSGRKRSVRRPVEAPVLESTRTETKTTGQIELSGLRDSVKSLPDLVRVCEIDLSEWDVNSWSCKAYGGYIKNAEKKVEKVQLFSVSAKLIRRKPSDPAVDLRTIVDEVRNYAPIYPAMVFHDSPRKSRRLLELTIPDLHIGKLAWGEECGTDYDSKIAEELFQEAVADLLKKTSGHAFDEILLVVGNDFLNVDNSQNTTSAGTPQDCDTRHAKTFKIARLLIQKTVEQLRAFAPQVTVMFVPGNHDTQSCYYLGEVLDAWFSKTDGVAVDNRPQLRKYFQFGRVLLGFTHGDKERPGDLPLLMATEVPNLWASTDHREIHTGHFHQRKATSWVGVSENKGVTVRILPSLCAPESWHVGRGYVGNLRAAEAYVWDSEEGLVGTAVFNVRPDRNQQAA